MEDYNKISIKFLLKTLKEEGVNLLQDSILIDKLLNKGVHIYPLKNGTYIILGADFYKNIDIRKCGSGLLVHNKKALDKMLKENYFPIEHTNPNIFERNKKELFTIHKNIPMKLEELAKKINFNQQINCDTFDSLEIVYNKIKRIKLTERDDRLFLLWATLLGEHISKKKGARWVLISYYGSFNQYFAPGLLYFDFVWELFFYAEKFFFKKSKISSFKQYYNLKINIPSPIKAASNHFKNHIGESRIINL